MHKQNQKKIIAAKHHTHRRPLLDLFDPQTYYEPPTTQPADDPHAPKTKNTPSQTRHAIRYFNNFLELW